MCLKRCGMSIQEMKEYLALCLEGPSTIPQRKGAAGEKTAGLAGVHPGAGGQRGLHRLETDFYDEVLAGKRPYVSNLIPTAQWEEEM